jgi:hypothetical protein
MLLLQYIEVIFLFWNSSVLRLFNQILIKVEWTRFYLISGPNGTLEMNIELVTKHAIFSVNSVIIDLLSL